MPPPEPRSSTVSPAFSSARAVGLPQPREAFTAAPGRALFCASSYRLPVMGSTLLLQQLTAAHVPPVVPEFTRRAASPYFSFTTSFISLAIRSLLIYSPVRIQRVRHGKHICQGVYNTTMRNDTVGDLNKLFRALADPTRLRLLNLMSEQEICV